LSTPHTAAATSSLSIQAEAELNDDVAATISAPAAKDDNNVDVNDDIATPVTVTSDTDSDLSDSTESSHSTSLSESEGSRQICLEPELPIAPLFPLPAIKPRLTS